MEFNVDYNRTEISEYTLRNFHLKAFKSAVEAGVGTVMSAFNEISGQPVTSSRYLSILPKYHLLAQSFFEL